jgi:hypothetical protein
MCQSSCWSPAGGCLGVLLVIGLAVGQAVVQLAEQFAAHAAQRCVMAVAGGAAGVASGPDAGRAGQRGERPPSAGVGEPVVARPPADDDAALAGGAGDRGGSGVAAAAGSVGKAGAVVTELAEYLGAEDRAQSGQAAQDLGVRETGGQGVLDAAEGGARPRRAQLGGCAYRSAARTP